MADQNAGSADEAELEREWLEATGEAPAEKAGEELADERAEDEAEDYQDGGDDGDTGDGGDDGEPEDDPWSSVSEDLRAERDALLKERDEFRQKYGSANGRLAPANRKIAELQAEVEKLRAAPQEPPVKDRIATLREDFPEMGDVLDKMQSDFDARFASFTEAQRRAQAAEEDRIEAEIEREHPGFNDLLASNRDDFAEWIEDQPRRVREIAERNRTGFVSASEVSELISLFKQHLEPEAPAATAATTQSPDPTRSRQMKALAAPPSRGRGSRQSISSNALDEDALWREACRAEGFKV